MKIWMITAHSDEHGVLIRWAATKSAAMFEESILLHTYEADDVAIERVEVKLTRAGIVTFLTRRTPGSDNG